MFSLSSRVLLLEGKQLLRLVRSTPKSSSFRPLSEAIPQLWTPQHRQYSSTCYRSHPKHDSNTKNVEKTNDKLSGNNLTVWFQKENRTLPNLITAMRIVASPGLTYAVMNDMKFWALGGCVVFGFSDWLDGYIAKNYNQMSRLGAFLDPLADKVMIGSLSIGLMYRDLLPGELVALILGRDLFLLSMAFIIRALEKPEGAAYFDTTSSATFEIIPSEISKINTGMQFLLLSSTLGQFACGVPSMAVIEPMWWITATTTLMSFAGYLDGSGVKFMSKKKFFEQIKAKLGGHSVK